LHASLGILEGILGGLYLEGFWIGLKRKVSMKAQNKLKIRGCRLTTLGIDSFKNEIKSLPQFQMLGIFGFFYFFYFFSFSSKLLFGWTEP